MQIAVAGGRRTAWCLLGTTFVDNLEGKKQHQAFSCSVEILATSTEQLFKPHRASIGNSSLLIPISWKARTFILEGDV